MTALMGVVITTVLAQTAPKEAPKQIIIPIQAVRISDDDGGRRAAISPHQVKHWVDYANEVYARAGIRFHYQVTDGLAERKSTLLNSVTGTGDHDWLQSKRLGNQVAAEHPGKLTMLFRHGPGPNPTGGGFSWVDYDFVVMPGFDVTTVCGRQNSGVLAHEVGHYFGLSHTFAREFETVAEADAWLKDHKGDASCFEGDGLSDTPPDPFIKAIQCRTEASILLQGRKIVFDRGDIMGYWGNPGMKHISPQQMEIVRWFVQRRTRSGMLLPTNQLTGHPLEAETLKISEQRGVHTSADPMGGWGAGSWSGDTHLFVKGQPGSGLTFDLPVEKTGHYQLCVYLTMGPDFGQIQPRLDGEPVGSPVDLYAPRIVTSGRIVVATRTLQAGRHSIGIEITGKNQASTGTLVGIDCFELATDENESKQLKSR